MWSEFCGPATANWNGPIQSRRGIGKGGAHEGDRPKNRLPAADRAKDSPNPSESKLVTAFFWNGGVGQNRYEVDDKNNVDSTPATRMYSRRNHCLYGGEKDREWHLCDLLGFGGAFCLKWWPWLFEMFECRESRGETLKGTLRGHLT